MPHKTITPPAPRRRRAGPGAPRPIVNAPAAHRRPPKRKGETSLDPRVGPLLFEALTTAAAATGSAATGASYYELRSAMALTPSDRARLAAGAGAVAAAHRRFFAKHAPAFELAATFAAVEAANINAAIATRELRAAEDGAAPEPLSGVAAAVAVALLLLPFVLLVLVFLQKGTHAL